MPLARPIERAARVCHAMLLHRLTQTAALVGLVLTRPVRAQEPLAPPAPLADTDGATSRPNLFGGQTYELPDGRQVDTHANIFGGRDLIESDSMRITCRT